MRILIVDDDPIALEMLRHALTRAGHEVVCAGNGREAVELAYETDSPFYTADALEALAIASGSAAAARDALRLFEAKGNLVAAARVRETAAAVRTTSTPG